MSIIKVDQIKPKTTGGAVTFPNKPVFRVVRSADQSIANDTVTVIQFT